MVIPSSAISSVIVDKRTRKATSPSTNALSKGISDAQILLGKVQMWMLCPLFTEERKSKLGEESAETVSKTEGCLMRSSGGDEMFISIVPSTTIAMPQMIILFVLLGRTFTFVVRAKR